MNSNQSSSLNLTSSSITLHHTPTLSRRNTLTVSARTSASPGSRSVRGAVSKVRGSRSTSNASKSKRQTNKNTEHATSNSVNVATDEMEDDSIENSTRQHDSEETAPLDVSTASADTVVNEHSNIRKKPQKHASEYFVFSKETNKYKCTICTQVKNILLLKHS